jgi:anti-sigma B factor antagonist
MTREPAPGDGGDDVSRVSSAFAMVVVAVDPLPRLEVRGELDLATAPQLRRRLDTLIGRSTTDVVVDLADAPFVDAAGVHVLVDAHRRLLADDRRLTITSASAATLRVLQLLGLEALFGTATAIGDVSTD